MPRKPRKPRRVERRAFDWRLPMCLLCCPYCGVSFAIPDKLADYAAGNEGWDVDCPNGHTLWLPADDDTPGERALKSRLLKAAHCAAQVEARGAREGGDDAK